MRKSMQTNSRKALQALAPATTARMTAAGRLVVLPCVGIKPVQPSEVTP